MLLEFFEFGAAPHKEQPAQVGSVSYAEIAQRECAVLIGQIRRQFGKEPRGSSLQIKCNSHDAGVYYTVALYYKDEKGERYALKIEKELAGSWDEQARTELAFAEN